MQRSAFTIGKARPVSFPSLSFTGIIVMAPEGQRRAHSPQGTPFVFTTQRSLFHTATPIWIDVFSARVIGLIASAGHTSEQRTQSGRQLPFSKNISGCMKWSVSVDGRSTLFGHCATHNWHAVQCLSKCWALAAPGGRIFCSRSGVFLGSMSASPPSPLDVCACSAFAVSSVALVVRNSRRPLSGAAFAWLPLPEFSPAAALCP